MAYRDSEYGSIAALRDSNYGGGLPPGAATPYRDNPNGTRENLPMSNMSPDRHNIDEKNDLYAAPRTKTKRKAIFWILAAVAVIILLIAVIVPVYLFVIKKSGDGDSGSSGNGGGHHTGTTGANDPTPTQTVVTTGGDGSVVTKEDGTTFIYNNTFGGYWVYDATNPLNQSARAQSYTPPLTEQWNWGVDQMYG